MFIMKHKNMCNLLIYLQLVLMRWCTGNCCYICNDVLLYSTWFIAYIHVHSTQMLHLYLPEATIRSSVLSFEDSISHQFLFLSVFTFH